MIYEVKSEQNITIKSQQKGLKHNSLFRPKDSSGAIVILFK